MVYYYDPGWGLLWGEVNGEPGYIPCARGLKLRQGDRVRLTGTVTPSRGLEAGTVTFTRMESGPPITAVEAKGRVANFEPLKLRLVTLEAIVNRQYLADAEHLAIELVAENTQIRLYHWSEQPKLLPLEAGDVVRVTGLYSPKHQTRTARLQVDLWVSEPEQIERIGSLSTDQRFTQPLASIESLPELAETRATSTRIAGVVRSYNPRESLMLRDGTGQVLVYTGQALPLRIGDVVEALGRSSTTTAEWTLQDALVRPASASVASMVRSAIDSAATLRVAEQVLTLPAEEAVAGRPVELIGTIMRPRSMSGFLFLADASGTVRVELGPHDHEDLKDGAGARIRGVTTIGRYAPAVRAENVSIWGNAIPPEPKTVSLEQAMTGQEEGERLELRGYVSRAVSDDAFTRLLVRTPTGEFTVVIKADLQWLALEGSIASFRGVCQAVADEQRQLTGIELFVSSEEDVHVEQGRLADPSKVPLRPIHSLRQFNAKTQENHWARIRGVVTHRENGRFVLVQDGTDGLLVLTDRDNNLRIGDLIEATGLPGLDARRVVLREAHVQLVSHANPPDPIALSETSTVVDTLENCLVSLRGHLISATAQGGGLHLLLEAGERVFAAVLANTPDNTALPDWEPGTELQLTGIYQVLNDERRRARDFRLQLRSLDDITVLQRPGWWSPERALQITATLCVFIAAGFTWLISLRRRVRRQTAQIRAQVAKEANLEARHRDIIENASDFIFTTDKTGRFTSFNPAGEHITGYTQEEAQAMYLRDLLTPDQENTDLWHRLQTQPDGTVTFQSHLRTRDNRIVWTETSARLIRDGGEPAGLLGIVRDISKRKQIEEELTRARDEAEANTRMKSSFLANMSHEIRTPMNGVIGMSNLLLETGLDAEQREFAETIRSSADSLLTVLNDILDFSKIEAGKLHFETVDFSPHDTVEGALELLAPKASAKGLEIIAFIAPEVPRYLSGDPGRLRQVLLNLLGNALKFTERGEVVLHATVLEESPTEAMLRFEVSDTGVGIAPDVVQKLFRPFSQADASTTRKFGGTGLGLAIAKQIVELMHGTIGVQSRLGVGSTFWFTVPFRKSTEMGGAEPLAPLDDLAGLRVLAVDDIAANRRIISHYARAWGLRAEVVAEARLAMVWLRQAAADGDPFRLVISDYQMPQMDGLTLARQIRQDPELGDVPFLLFTAMDRGFPPGELQQLGITTVVNKPIRASELLHAIRRTIGTLPPVLDPAVVSTRDTQRPRGGSGETVIRGRVLVAEDNAVNQRVIRLQLEKLGFAADVVGNGFEVLEAIERNRYDVVLMDCQMPEMDGYETTCRIRTGAHGHLYIVALTANAMEGDREQCLAAGMDDYLSKPTRPADLAVALTRALARNQSRRAAAA